MEWTFQNIILAYLILINIFTFFAFGLDKASAAAGTRRTSEAVLWAMSLIGGSIGGFAGMHFFRHKTQKISFQLIMVFIVLFQGLLIWIFFR